MRLTNPLRERINDELAQHRIKTLRKDLDNRERDLAFRLYRTVVSEDVEKHADMLNELVPGMVRCNSNIHVSANGNSGHLYMVHARPAPNGGIHLVLLEKDDFYQEAAALLAEKKSFGENHKAAVRASFAQLAKFTTVEALAAGWPEVMPIAQPVIDEWIERQNAKQVKVPALVPDELNGLFGLPVEEMAEAA